jgi:hypothetical protein
MIKLTEDAPRLNILRNFLNGVTENLGFVDTAI